MLLGGGGGGGGGTMGNTSKDVVVHFMAVVKLSEEFYFSLMAAECIYLNLCDQN